MRCTVCELRDDVESFAEDWAALVQHARVQESELVLLPEMPFFPWFATRRDYDPQAWQAAETAHAAWLERLDGLTPARVLFTRPLTRAGRRLNGGILWQPGAVPRLVHEKYYLPDDEGFWEASWYQRGGGEFAPFEAGAARVGTLICTELWFQERARAYGKQGIHLLAVPRATGAATVDKWLAGGRTAAVVSGAFCLSSNHAAGADPSADLGGRGWIIDPDGQVLGLTSPEQPFLTLDLDLAVAEQAKLTYPRYVLE